MGVNSNLWDLFKPYVRHEGFDFIRDKKVAVDLSFWIVQHETSISSSARNPHLRLTFFRTINLFVKFGAFPVFVVDGIPSPLKAQARIARFYRYSGVDLSSLPSSPDKGVSVERSRAFRQCVQECVKNSLLSLFNNKVKCLVGEILDGESRRDVCFEDFLWANSVFWTRALNIPFPHSYVFPEYGKNRTTGSFSDIETDTTPKKEQVTMDQRATQRDGVKFEKSVLGEQYTPPQEHTIWVEGLVPGIDFCNHDILYRATWEVDSSGDATKIPFSMYLLCDGRNPIEAGKEVTISYGNKGNEELLYLYGFVIEDNPDDYLMVHIPVDMLQKLPHSDSKTQLLEAQKASTKCLLPKSLLDCGFFSMSKSVKDNGGDRCGVDKSCSYSWSGQRKIPEYAQNLVFPEDFMAALRTVAMQESHLYMVSSMLEEIGDSRLGISPTDTEIRSAIWEVCGDDGALLLLVDILNMKLVDLEEGSGKEERDNEILSNVGVKGTEKDFLLRGGETMVMSKKRWSSIVYRRGQKQLTRLFLNEARHALQLCISK